MIDKRARLLIGAVVIAVAGIGSAQGQSEFPTPTPGQNVVGVANMCLNGSNQMVPVGASCSAGGALPAGAATAAKQDTGNTSLGTIATNTTGVASSIGSNGSTAKTSSNLMGVSDGTNQQQVVAPIGLADGVNGNNSMSVGGYVWNGTTWDRMPGTTAGVKVKAGGYDFNKSVIPTVQNAAYAAGQSLGGLQTISVGATNSLTGILDQISIASTGGSTVAVVAYVWDTNPASTTCTDKTSFVKSQADNQHLVTGAPISLTPALVASAQDTSTYATAGGLTGNFANGSSNTNLYVCVLANASVTPGTTTDYRLNIQGLTDAP